MSPLIYALVMLAGGILVQDGLASICWYRNSETWKNHLWRLPRIVIGFCLMILAGIQLWAGAGIALVVMGSMLLL